MGKISLTDTEPTWQDSKTLQRLEKSRQKRGFFSLLFALCPPLMFWRVAVANHSHPSGSGEADFFQQALVFAVAISLPAASVWLGILSGKTWSGRLGIILSLPQLFFSVFFLFIAMNTHS